MAFLRDSSALASSSLFCSHNINQERNVYPFSSADLNSSSMMYCMEMKKNKQHLHHWHGRILRKNEGYCFMLCGRQLDASTNPIRLKLVVFFAGLGF
jgi:hypothetical protein